MRIAICDDCTEDALSLKNYMKSHEVSVYADTDSFLADIENKKIWYDLYLLDIFMEKSMNGMELARRLRKIQEEAVKQLLGKVSKNLVRNREQKLSFSPVDRQGAFPTERFCISAAGNIPFISAAQMAQYRNARAS